MIKFKNLNNKKPTMTETAEDIEIGTTFTGQIECVNSIFLRIYAEVVNLNDPSQTWNGLDNLNITDYEPVDLIVTVVPVKK